MVRKLQSRIQLKDWLALKPYNAQATTDIEYIKVCNLVKQAINSSTLAAVLPQCLSKQNVNEDVNMLACFLTSYLEDLVSGTNIWDAFVDTHQKMYNKPLPFYNLDEYDDEEFNLQDIRFLIWYFLSTIQDENLMNPKNNQIKDAAQKVMEVLENAWDTVPENYFLYAYYIIDKNEENYWLARDLMETILFNSYLFYPDTGLKLAKSAQKVTAKFKDSKNYKNHIIDHMIYFTYTAYTKLLSLNGREWAAGILGGNHQINSAFLNMSERLSGLFLYKSQDPENLYIEHIASSKKFAITKKSFKHSYLLEEVDNILSIGIVKWKGEWWFSGTFFQFPFNADTVLDEKNSTQSRMAVNFLDTTNKGLKSLKKRLDAFLAYNGGHQIAFMPTDKLDDFITNFVKYCNNSLGLSAKEIEEKKQRIRADGFFQENLESTFFSTLEEEHAKTGLVFFNPKNGLEIALGMNSAFPLPNNPYFEVDDSENCIHELFTGTQFSTELAMFCVNNCKNDLPFFAEPIGKQYLEDIDFLLRFWKAKQYHSKPNLTMIDIVQEPKY